MQLLDAAEQYTDKSLLYAFVKGIYNADNKKLSNLRWAV